MAEVISFDSERGYLGDPAETDYQKGYLAAALDLYREGIGRGGGDDRLTILDAQVRA